MKKSGPPKALKSWRERFLGSEPQRGLHSSLVARRVAQLHLPADRELVWWLAEYSFRRLGKQHPTCPKFTSHAFATLQPGTPALEHLASELCALFPEQLTERPAAVLRELPPLFNRLCLDPGCAVASVKAKSFHDLLPALRAFKTKVEAAHLSAVASTSVSRSVWEALDYGQAQRGIVLLEGHYRAGKSISAQAWCLARAGRTRYASLTAYTDSATFMRTLAASLGVASVLQNPRDTRQRVEETLRGRDLMLVIDEGENLIPSTLRPKAAPERLKFLISLDNLGVPVALIAGANFSRQLAAFERHMPSFGFEQFWGRVRLHQQLPDALAEADLFAISQSVAPDLSKPLHKYLVAHTLAAKGRVAALETALNRARFFAALAGRPVNLADLEQAAAEASPRPGRAMSRPAREAVATPARHPRGDPSEILSAATLPA